jgi:hypothetical protein
MSSNWADLEGSLAASGLPASAAKLIANALANLDSPRTTTGENRMDSTPSQALRMIDSDSRRYRFTNLDQRSNAVSRRAARNRDTNFLLNAFQHPYDNTQPIKGGESITKDRVEAGKFVSVSKTVDDGTVSYEVGLEVQGSGQFVGINQTRDVLRTLDFSVTSGDPTTIKAVPSKQENSTNIAISPINLQTIPVKLSDNTTRNILSWVPDATVTDAPIQDVYEEGTWTPSYSLVSPPSGTSEADWTFTTTTATYTRLGKIVFWQLRFAVATTETVSKGKLDVLGLPHRVAVEWYMGSAAENDLPLFVYATPGNNTSDPTRNFRLRFGDSGATGNTNVFASGWYVIHPDEL